MLYLGKSESTMLNIYAFPVNATAPHVARIPILHLQMPAILLHPWYYKDNIMSRSIIPVSYCGCRHGVAICFSQRPRLHLSAVVSDRVGYARFPSDGCSPLSSFGLARL